MADLEFYRLSMTGSEADSGIRTGMEAGATSGVLLGDGNGGVTAATPGQDFGYPLIKGNGPPTGNTAANIGQHYFDMQATQAPYEYICVGLNSNGFIWLVFGDAGNGFIISGYFASIDALNAAIAEGIVKPPTPGVNYAIGTEPPYDTVTWDGVANDWKNNGPLGASGGGSGVPPHGTTGQVLTKLSDVDGDAGWKDIALKGEGAPTASTVGMIGQLYVDTTATENPAYICVGITTADNVTTYVWQPVGGTIEDGSITADMLAPDAIPDALGYNPGMVNPNLIDNWYFVGGGSQQGGGHFPINQRGKTSWNVTESTYCLDRWLFTSAVGTVSMFLSAKGLVAPIHAIAHQVIENADDLDGMKLTFSVLYDNNLTTVSFTWDKTAAYTNLLTDANGVRLAYYGSQKYIQFYNTAGSSATFAAAKLEHGSKQTFARQENGQWVLNETPNFGEQLARCQRYYVVNVGQLCPGYYTTGKAEVLIATPQPLRTTPALTIVNLDNIVLGNGAVVPITGLNSISYITNSGVCCILNTGSVSVGNVITCVTGSFACALSADL